MKPHHKSLASANRAWMAQRHRVQAEYQARLRGLARLGVTGQRAAFHARTMMQQDGYDLSLL